MVLKKGHFAKFKIDGPKIMPAKIWPAITGIFRYFLQILPKTTVNMRIKAKNKANLAIKTAESPEEENRFSGILIGSIVKPLKDIDLFIPF